MTRAHEEGQVVSMDYSVLSKYRSELMGCAMLWVMLFHLRDAAASVPLLGELSKAGFAGVDMFLLLSCVGLVRSLGNREQSFIRFMGRRCMRIMPAYFTVMIPFTLWLIAANMADWSTLFWNATLMNYWVRAKGGFNWYVSGIMLFYAMTPWGLANLERSRRPVLRTAGMMLLGYGVCRLIMADDWWCYIDVFYRLPMFFLALLIGLWAREGRKLDRRTVLLWAAWFTVGLVYLVGVFTVPEEPFYLPLCHFFLFSTVPMCLTGCFLFEKLPLGWLRRFLRLVGESSLEIYLLNVSFFTQTDLPRRLLGFLPGGWFFYPVSFGVNILLGVLLHRAIGLLTAKWRVSAGQDTGKEVL